MIQNKETSWSFSKCVVQLQNLLAIGCAKSLDGLKERFDRENPEGSKSPELQVAKVGKIPAANITYIFSVLTHFSRHFNCYSWFST